jgi:glyoxylase-like metal-dependent hydrolase (beta-lactamase superfamily II)
MDRNQKNTRVHTLRVKMANAYLIENETGMVLFDCGAPGSENRIIRKMNEIGRDDLKLIYISHAHIDHYGSAAALREMTGADIAIHTDDSQDMALGNSILGRTKGRGFFIHFCFPLIERIWTCMPTTADILLEDGDTLNNYDFDAIVLHTPGHTDGSSSLILKNGDAFVGDLISSSGQPRAQRFFAQDWDQIPASIQRLSGKNPKRVYTGHGKSPLEVEGSLPDLLQSHLR